MVAMRMLGALCLAAAVTPAPAWSQQKVDLKKSATADGRVSIDNGAGTLRVVGWNREEITVTGTLGRRAEGIDFSGSPQRTTISVETHGNPHGVKSDLEVHVPAGSRLEIDGFATEITVLDVTGVVQADSVNGSISISGRPREVKAETVNGSITVDGTASRVHAESVNGPVTVKGASGEVEASTVNGILVVTGGLFERARLETVSGSVRFEGELGPKGVLEAECVSGGVDLAFPARQGMELNVTSFSGDIRSEFGGEVRKVNKWTSEKELRFTVGSGGSDVTVSTLSGSVTIRKK
jgi:DUF4097 and DUF4098 domain-containing protein YvlB